MVLVRLSGEINPVPQIQPAKNRIAETAAGRTPNPPRPAADGTRRDEEDAAPVHHAEVE